MVVNGLLLAAAALPAGKNPSNNGVQDYIFPRREKSLDPTWIRTTWPRRYTDCATPGPPVYIAYHVS